MENVNRGISERFAQLFKDSALYQLYQKHQNELFLGVRSKYINLYYNCDSISKVKMDRGGDRLICEINPYYLGTSTAESKTVKLTPEEVVEHYDAILAKSREKARNSNEKKAQQQLAMRNNSNLNSNWFCVDLEYCKASHQGRFDIIAVSKAHPHRVALIELKYSSGAISGKSGIVKHVADFSEYYHSPHYENLKNEIIDVVKSMKMLGVSVPKEIQSLSTSNFTQSPEYFFITLNNNALDKYCSTPKQTMAAYLFKEGTLNYVEWGCKRPSTKCIESEYGDITKKSNKNMCATFLFSTEKYSDILIDDIIDGRYTERILPQ